MNETIKTILDHRSIRSFLEKELSEEQIRLIVESAQAASTSSFVQAYSIIGIKEPAKKTELARLAGNQAYVAKNGHFFVFCLDLNRLRLAAQLEGIEESEIFESLSSTELYTVGVVDAALAAQNASIAAESMGLGICYIGGLRNALYDVSALLKTPDHVVPLFGLCVGYVDNRTDKKQRLPMDAIYHEEEYKTDEKMSEQLHSYNRDISDYYLQRTGGKRADRWTEMMANKLTNAQRLYLKQFLHDKKLPLN
ncbi:oxygen-insensitive NADPH nitroreductase [Shimazuella sp. AN120528]|uniref:oxygen-insensitive NADPH nitroreductase n=1 Tax=Shimazuella soli TaxID=1892854 RepID=UPI001F0CF03B|nr:oxygen-insensitive NADPH nitroreductase [Shimazuella soli]MCH5586273.1 oxygen-insensitive NADPH nitroreductase [Shimazuella soli]